MSLDIKYRPRTYDDVLGQEATIAILRQYVAQGRGFRQSYLFCGNHGSGKTTLGRILARALLCEHPKDGNPCDECDSCRGLLEDNTSADFTEVDAATHSGKADVKAITELIQYDTFSGKRRIYLFDEAHQLSKDALDALLKPLEDTLPGSEDKRLVCIFCTTEPEKMRATVLSRCAPAFVIQPQTPQLIASRLAAICEKEGIDHDPDMLVLIAEMTECHVRDALKAVEGVSMLGGVIREHVTSYLHLDLNTAYLDLLDAIGSNLEAAFEAAKLIMQRASPVTCYEKLAEVAMLSYQTTVGGNVPAHWGRDRLKELGIRKGMSLLGYASRFASRPGKPTAAMLLMDIAHLHHVGGQVTDSAAVIQVQTVGGAVPPSPPSDRRAEPSPPPAAPVVVAPETPTPAPAQAPAVSGGASSVDLGTIPEQDLLWVRAQMGPAAVRRPGAVTEARSGTSSALKPAQFAELLKRTLADLGAGSGGPAR